MFGVRHVQVILLFLANLINHASKNNLNVALLAMTDKSVEKHFDIDLKFQNALQSCLFWGYFVSILPAGELVTRFGGKKLLLLAMFMNTVAALVIPFCTYIGPQGWKMIFVCRVIQGVFQGFVIPSVLTIISKWVPAQERSRLGSLAYSGIHLGNGFQILTSGYLADYWGWPSVFYFHAILGFSWFILFSVFGAESPAQSKFISEKERSYIQNSLGFNGKTKKLRTPWRVLMTSPPFIALVFAFCGFKWGYHSLVAEIPTYMNKVHGVNLRENGALSALPFLVLFISTYPLGYIADFILKKKLIGLTPLRKIFTTLGFLGPAAWLIAAAQTQPGDKVSAITFLTLAIASIACIYPGFMMSPLDMAPNYAGAMNAVSNIFANFMSILGPIAAGLMLGDDGSNRSRWQLVFYVAVAMYVTTWAFYLMFADCKRQPWNDPNYNKKSVVISHQ
ncbi:unnamed protein product [Leptosia nina]|uniref:Major facilitator superfamily (MFS) profile domain-containing protein n=1 Tax=Leptosia nina TaxID=320188 RepID=A0AAV1JT38_9NEOP